MRKSILIIVMLISRITANGQLVLEHTYSVPPGTTFYYTDLGNNNYKYFYIDYYNNYFNLYNLDHTPFILNIVPPVSLDSAHNTIAYISNSLFDCDSTNIEYAVTTNGNSIYDPFYVFRTDGTLLFQKDSVVTVWCFGCFGGSTIKPIFNTPSGSKLILANLTTNDWSIYALCGLLPQLISKENEDNQYVKVYPNPTSGSINLQISSPSSFLSYELNIYNSSLQLIESKIISGFQTIFLDNLKMESGNYYFSLQSNQKIFQTGKFTITK